jgi:hypothetical protein
MPFPPNYRLDKASRARSKAQKALEKQTKREEKSAQRKQEREDAGRTSEGELDKGNET